MNGQRRRFDGAIRASEPAAARTMPRARIKYETAPEVQRAFLVGVEFRNPAYRTAGGATHLPLESSMEELALLCKTAGLEVVGQTTRQTRTRSSARARWKS